MRLHGRAEERVVGPRRVRLFPVFHPAAALYTPSNVDVLRQDFQRLPGLLALGAPEQPPVPSEPAPEEQPPVDELARAGSEAPAGPDARDGSGASDGPAPDDAGAAAELPEDGAATVAPEEPVVPEPHPMQLGLF
jgi:DNA polymerase